MKLKNTRGLSAEEHFRRRHKTNGEGAGRLVHVLVNSVPGCVRDEVNQCCDQLNIESSDVVSCRRLSYDLCRYRMLLWTLSLRHT